MKKLDSLLTEYKEAKLFQRATTAGPGDQEQNLVQQQAILENRLEDLWNFTDKILIVIFIVLIAFVIFLGILIWKYYQQTAVVVGLVTGQGGGIYFAIDQMHKLYKESVTSRMLLVLLRAAGTTEERQKIIDSVMIFLKN